MKNLTTAFLITILVLGCKKDELNKTGGGSSTQTSSVSSTEAYLTAHWIFDSAVYYQAGVPTLVQVASVNNQNDYVYDAFSTVYSGGASNYKNLVYGRSGQSQTAFYWYVSDVYLNASGLLWLQGGVYFGGYIISSCNNKLVTSGNYGSVKQGFYYYLHK